MAKPEAKRSPFPSTLPRPEAELVTCMALVRRKDGKSVIVETSVPAERLRVVGTAGDLTPVRTAFLREVSKRYVMQPPLKVDLP